MSRGRLTLVLGLAAVVAPVALAGATRVHPLYSTPLAIRTVAQDGTRIAWVSGPCNSVSIRGRNGGPAKVVGNASSVDCGPIVPPRLALAGARALWTNTSAGNNVYTDVMTGAPGERQRRLEQTVGSSGGGDGDYFTYLAGDGSTLVYSTVTMTQLDTCIDPGTPCAYFVNSGRVRRVVGRTARRVPHALPAVKLAVSGRRIALIAAAHDSPADPAPSGRVEVRNAITGRLVTGFTVQSTALDIALGPNIVAVLVRRIHQPLVRGLVVECRAARNGALVSDTAVSEKATDLSISGRDVVFRVGRSIRLLDAVTGDTRKLAIAKSAPIGLSADGRWAVWGERFRGRARIVSVPFD